MVWFNWLLINLSMEVLQAKGQDFYTANKKASGYPTLFKT